MILQSIQTAMSALVNQTVLSDVKVGFSSSPTQVGARPVWIAPGCRARQERHLREAVITRTGAAFLDLTSPPDERRVNATLWECPPPEGP
jgi:hypothetical protein